MARPAPLAPDPRRARQTALFLAIALGGSYAIGAVWFARPEWGWITQYLMWTPGVASLWSGSVWPSVVAHFSWNFWNPFFLGNQYGGGASIFGGELWLINGEGLLGVVVNGALTVALVVRWRAEARAAQPA